MVPEGQINIWREGVYWGDFSIWEDKQIFGLQEGLTSSPSRENPKNWGWRLGRGIQQNFKKVDGVGKIVKIFIK